MADVGVGIGAGATAGATAAGPWGAAIGAGVGALGSMWSNSQEKKAAKRAFKYQVALMNMQNEYNLPINQMRRYAEAGLNPNLVYGQQNLSASPSTVHAAKVHDPVAGAVRGAGSAMEALKLGQDLQLGQEQIQQVRAATLNAYVQALKGAADADTVLYDLGIARDRNIPYRATMYEKVLASVFGATRKTAAGITGGILNYLDSHRGDFDKEFESLR